MSRNVILKQIKVWFCGFERNRIVQNYKKLLYGLKPAEKVFDVAALSSSIIQCPLCIYHSFLMLPTSLNQNQHKFSFMAGFCEARYELHCLIYCREKVDAKKPLKF